MRRRQCQHPVMFLPNSKLHWRGDILQSVVTFDKKQRIEEAQESLTVRTVRYFYGLTYNNRKGKAGN